MRTLIHPSLISAATLVAAGATALANPATVIFASRDHAGASGKDAVPGVAGAQFTTFGEAYGSDGTKWITAANITGGGAITSTDQVVLVGDGAAFSNVAREGVTVVGSGGQLLNLSGLAVPRIAGEGSWAIAFTPAAGVPGLVAKNTAGVYSTLALGGTPSAPLGANYGPLFTSPCLDAAGNVAFLNDQISTTISAAFTNNGANLLAQEGVTLFTGPQPGGSQGSLSDISFSLASTTLFVSADGAHTLYLATGLDTSLLPHRSVVLDGQIVMQVDWFFMPNPSEFVTAITEIWMEPVGTWFARGTASASGTGGNAFITRDGVVIARVGQPITPGSTETWSTLIDMKGDNAGNYVVIGTTSAAATANDVVVQNGSLVIAREGDPVDLNGDGLFNDNLFIHSFRDRCFMGNDGMFYVGARMKATAAGSSSLGANVSMIRIPLTPTCPCPADFDGSGGTPDVNDVDAFFGSWLAGLPAADTDCSGGTPDAGDIDAFFAAWLRGGC